MRPKSRTGWDDYANYIPPARGASVNGLRGLNTTGFLGGGTDTNRYRKVHTQGNQPPMKQASVLDELRSIVGHGCVLGEGTGSKRYTGAHDEDALMRYKSDACGDPGANESGEYKLWAAVIEQAVADFRGWDKGHRVAAREWFLSEDFEVLCELLRLNVNWFRKELKLI